MNISHKWLLDYVKPAPGAAGAAGLGPKEIAGHLTRIGLNVDAIEALPGGDAGLLVEVTSNRPDCLGHVGVARELAAALGADLVLPQVALEESDEACADLARVEVAELDLCPLYTARIIRGVKVGPSPEWLRRRLEAVGLRPVNNIVDVTNFVMMECAQPLHAFDYARLADRRIVVRRAHSGERFIAIDHSEHSLSPERLVIADGRRAVALAGVMGGVDTEISDATRDVLLEAAVFDPLSIRTTARTLAMASESSYRFERRVDPHGTDWASRRACGLIAQTAGGKVARGVCAAGKPLPEPREVSMRVGRIETVLGMAVPAETAAGILARLGLEIVEAGAERITVRVPSWRPDLEREIDLVEEVARHHGYDKIPTREHIRVAYSPPTKTERVRQAVSQVLTAAGYCEAVTFSFTSREKAARLASAKADGEPLAVRGTPLVLRESVLPGLLDSLRVNQNAGESGARLFEVARRFVPVRGRELPQEAMMLALASGDDFEAVKGVIEAVAARLRIGDRLRFVAAEAAADLQAGQSAEVLLDDEPIGTVGRVTKATADAFELDEPPTVAEVQFERLIDAAVLEPTYRPLPQYPAVVRDLALVVDEAVRWADITKAVAAAALGEVESVQPIDVYRGKQVPEGKKSVAIRVVLRSPSATLTRQQADEMQAAILEALKAGVGATLRQ